MEDGMFNPFSNMRYKNIFVLKQSLKETHSFAPSFNLRRAMH
jgi:hypothetical protein